MRKCKRTSDISEMNRLDIRSFKMCAINDDPVTSTLHLMAETGSSSLEVHLRFIETVYIWCVTTCAKPVHWRLATEQETSLISQKANEDRATIYCIEERGADSLSALESQARTFFIVAWGLDITVSYEEEVADMVRDWGHEF